MEKGVNKQNFRKSGRKKTVAGKDLVASIPPVRILNGVGLNVPVAIVGVPVRVHGPKPKYTTRHQCHCLLNILKAVSYLEPQSSPAHRTDSFLFFKNLDIDACQRIIRGNSAIYIFRGASRKP
jgi:hypothetical protein